MKKSKGGREMRYLVICVNGLLLPRAKTRGGSSCLKMIGTGRREAGARGGSGSVILPYKKNLTKKLGIYCPLGTYISMKAYRVSKRV